MFVLKLSCPRSEVWLTLCGGFQWLILRTSDQKPEDNRQFANLQLPYSSRNNLGALFGNPIQAQQEAIAALTVSKGRDIQFATALALAFAWDAPR